MRAQSKSFAAASSAIAVEAVNAVEQRYRNGIDRVEAKRNRPQKAHADQLEAEDARRKRPE